MRSNQKLQREETATLETEARGFDSPGLTPAASLTLLADREAALNPFFADFITSERPYWRKTSLFDSRSTYR